MRPSIFAVSLAAALIMTAAGALAEPPWAPAHGWRRKNTQYYERKASYVVPDLGIELGRCNRDVIGAVIGGAAGGAIGSRIRKSSERTVGPIGGKIFCG